MTKKCDVCNLEIENSKFHQHLMVEHPVTFKDGKYFHRIRNQEWREF
ncbi:MAG TPA: hypothetical protein VFX18_03240 [Candidatus Nitrosocosmicus sp.]|nr:hypothetical protein [Candidatus Nitrosocosmicus sp.]